VAGAVEHPAHYGGDTTYETIKVIEAWELGFHLGNAVKYISRAGKKDPTKTLEDIDKAIWYLQQYRLREQRKRDKLLEEAALVTAAHEAAGNGGRGQVNWSEPGHPVSGLSGGSCRG